MPRIDPFQLLKCLSVLLGPTGGIKSKEEVHRLANLMTKFSKKLVSKCIYIQILKTTDTDLLSQFMDAGGWSLIHMWLTDGIVAKNWALIQELLELLLLCPVKIERLKSNNCPKLIKGLSKEVSHQVVRILAGHLVEQWLKIVKGEAAPNSVPAQIIGSLPSDITLNSMGQLEHQFTTTSVTTSGSDLVAASGVESASSQVQNVEQKSVILATNSEAMKPTNSQIVEETTPVTLQTIKQSSSLPTTSIIEKTSPVPVCKITIRDGDKVLAKVETEASNIINATHEMNGDTGAADYEESGESEGKEDGAVNHLDSSEVKQQTSISTKDAQLTANAKSKDDSNVKDTVSCDSNKSSDKENRDSHKTDDSKKSTGSCNNSSSSISSEKKSSGSHHGSSSSSSRSGTSSSKHSSSSHRSGSSSHKSSSSHRSSSSSSRSSKDKSSRDKDRHSSSSSKHSSSSSSSSRSKSDRDKEKEKEKEKLKKDQAEKDKATLEKVQAQAISTKLGKIPRKKAEDEKNSAESLFRKSSTDSRDSSKENKEKTDAKKVAGSTSAATPAPPPVIEKKQISISIENRKNSQDSSRPKTVKTFNSKFRSTGLEEEVKPPLPRSATAKKPIVLPTIEKKTIPTKAIGSLKRTSPLRETLASSDKRLKLSLDPPVTSPTEEKKGAIKLIPPKPKPMVLQESDMFMDALTASTKGKEPRKRKRRTSITKDSASDAKKSEKSEDGGHDSPQHPLSPQSADERSPLTVKPNFKFYQDTLETDEDKEEKLDEQTRVKKEEESVDRIKAEAEENDDDEMSITNVVKNEIAATIAKNEAKLAAEEEAENAKAEVKSPDAEEANSENSDFTKNGRSSSPLPEIRYVDGLRSVLHLQKRKGPKKNLKWKTELESIRYFELDETERVNVTKTFTDMKQMEKQNEREAFQMARKLSTDDVMEEKTRWKPLIPIDLLPALVEPGKDSREKDIQYAREKGILQALYFNRSMIPDSAAEPDEERHHTITDPKIIPLEDLTGNKESEKDFTGVAWPEPKPHLTPPQPPPVMHPPGFHFPGGFPHQQPPMMPQMPPQGPMGPPMQMGPPPGPMQMGPPPGPMNQMGPGDMGSAMSGPPPSGGGGGGGGWRTGDGKVVVPDVGMNPMQQQQQPMPPNMPGGFPPGMDGPPMVPPGMMGPPMFNQQENFGMMGPEDMGFGNYQGPPGPGMFGPGPNFPGGPPRGGGPMHGNRGRGNGPGWFRGGGPGGGPMRGGGGWRGGWRGNGKQPPICRQFTKNGFCRVGDKCQYLHPGVNCPPF